MRLNLFWKLALSFLTLLIVALVGIDISAESVLRRDYESASLEQLKAVAAIGLDQPLVLSAIPPFKTEEIDAMHAWVKRLQTSGARVTVITSQGLVLATAHAAKFAEVVEKAIGMSPPLPDRLAAHLKKPKLSLPMSSSYEDFKRFLLEN